MTTTKDRFGREWNLPKGELCSTCGQPDCSDCNHQRLADAEVLFLGGTVDRNHPSTTTEGSTE